MTYIYKYLSTIYEILLQLVVRTNKNRENRENLFGLGNVCAYNKI